MTLTLLDWLCDETVIEIKQEIQPPKRRYPLEGIAKGIGSLSRRMSDLERLLPFHLPSKRTIQAKQEPVILPKPSIIQPVKVELSPTEEEKPIGESH